MVSVMMVQVERLRNVREPRKGISDADRTFQSETHSNRRQHGAIAALLSSQEPIEDTMRLVSEVVTDLTPIVLTRGGSLRPWST